MGRWVPMGEAADILGVSFDTIKRRARLGQIPKRQEKTARGFRWLVEVPAEPAHAGRHVPGEAGGATRAASREHARETTSAPVLEESPGNPVGTALEETAQQLALLQQQVEELQRSEARLSREVELQREMIEDLRGERAFMRDQLAARAREVEQLHILLQRAQESQPVVALPSPRPVRTVSPVRVAAARLLDSVRESWWWRSFMRA